MSTHTTWLQFFERRVTELAAEYDCTKAEAEPGARCELGDWQASVLAALQTGWIPDQSWINATNADSELAYWWKMRICHDHPDIFDRVARAGRSMFMSLTALDAKAEAMARNPT